MKPCRQCGSSDWYSVIDSRVRVVERCNVCGKERMTLISPADPVLPPNLEPVFTVMARWSRSPTTQDIDELRDEFLCMPETNDEILRKAHRHDWFSLGRCNESEMQLCAPLLTRLGLELDRIPVDET